MKNKIGKWIQMWFDAMAKARLNYYWTILQEQRRIEKKETRKIARALKSLNSSKIIEK